MPSLRCPACRTVAMKAYLDSALALEIDSCPQCDGIWFDANELGRFLKSKVFTERFMYVSSEPQESVGFTINSTRRSCPRCKVMLKEETCAGIVLDICGQCQGLWFDEGEVRQVAERFKQGSKVAAPEVLGELSAALKVEKDPMRISLLGALTEFFRGITSQNSASR
jgi:uncharacterized protein